eukprot:6214656-Pleurochrysis_carterae.AAC.2
MSHLSVTVSSAAVPTNCVVNSSASGYSKSEQKRCNSELSNQLLWMSACTSTESGSSLRRNAAPRVLPTTHPPNANGARDGSSNQNKTEPSVKISATFAATNSDKPTKRGDSMALPPASHGVPQEYEALRDDLDAAGARCGTGHRYPDGPQLPRLARQPAAETPRDAAHQRVDDGRLQLERARHFVCGRWWAQRQCRLRRCLHRTRAPPYNRLPRFRIASP